MSAVGARIAKLEHAAGYHGRVCYFMSNGPAHPSRDAAALVLSAAGHTLKSTDLILHDFGAEGDESAPLQLDEASPFTCIEDWIDELDEKRA